MKIPKNLQNKNRKGSLRKKENISTEILIQAFKGQFSRLIEKFEETRKIEYVYEIDEVGAKIGNKPRFAVKWDEEKIQVVIFEEQIKEISAIITSLIRNINLVELHKQIAKHEYGHILSAKTTYDLYPDEAKNYNVFELSQEQLLPMHHSPLENQLKQVSIDRLIGIFWEFLGNYKVREKIEENFPSESLKSKRANILNTIQQIESRGSFTLYNPNTGERIMDKGFDRFFLLQENSDEFYLFDKWDEFCALFHRKEIEESLKLMNRINKLFEKIIQINTKIENMKEDVIELAKSLDRLDFAKITQKNLLSDSDKDILKEFIGYLREKEDSIRKMD